MPGLFRHRYCSAVADYHFLTFTQSFQYLHLDTVGDAGADSSFQSFSVSEYFDPVAVVTKFLSQGRNRNGERLFCLIQYDGHLGSHGNLQPALCIGNLEQTIVIDRRTGR